MAEKDVAEAIAVQTGGAGGGGSSGSETEIEVCAITLEFLVHSDKFFFYDITLLEAPPPLTMHIVTYPPTYNSNINL